MTGVQTCALPIFQICPGHSSDMVSERAPCYGTIRYILQGETELRQLSIYSRCPQVFVEETTHAITFVALEIATSSMAYT